MVHLDRGCCCHCLDPTVYVRVDVPQGAYGYSHDITGAFHSRYGSLAAMDAQLISKRESLLQQVHVAHDASPLQQQLMLQKQLAVLSLFLFN